MILKNLYENLQNHQIGYVWINSISKLEWINLDTQEWKFLFILETLRMWKALWFKIFKESNKELSKQELKRLFAWAKSYHSNRPIVTGKLRFIIEWLAYDFKDLDLNYDLVSWILDEKITISNFLKWVKSQWQDDSNKDLDQNKIIQKWFLFVGKSGKTYSWDNMSNLRIYKEVDLLDIIEWYSWENEILKKVIPYILNNKDELKKEFKQYRLSIISALSILLWLESKAVNYILPKLENKETNETQTVSSVAPF